MILVTSSPIKQVLGHTQFASAADYGVAVIMGKISLRWTIGGKWCFVSPNNCNPRCESSFKDF